MERPYLFRADNVAERARRNIALCDRCKNYQTPRCPCGRFDRNDPVLREQLCGLHDCCDFDYFDPSFGQKELDFGI